MGTIVDAGTGLKLKDIAVGSGNHVGHIVFSADSKKAYATNASDGALYVIDLQTREVVKGIPTGDKAAQVINTHTNLFEVPGYISTLTKPIKKDGSVSYLGRLSFFSPKFPSLSAALLNKHNV